MIRPVTYMLPVTARPTRPLIVSDPSKLSYFAQANMIRSGMGGASALSGFGDAAPTNTVASADNSVVASGGQTVGSFLRSLVEGFIKSDSNLTTLPPPPVEAPAPDDTFMGLPRPVAVIGGLVLAGGLGYYAYKKLR